MKKIATLNPNHSTFHASQADGRENALPENLMGPLYMDQRSSLAFPKRMPNQGVQPRGNNPAPLESQGLWSQLKTNDASWQLELGGQKHCCQRNTLVVEFFGAIEQAITGKNVRGAFSSSFSDCCGCTPRCSWESYFSKWKM